MLLTTFRRDGCEVPTPVWIAQLGDQLVVSTPEGTGKLKRLKHTPRVTFQPCSRRGVPREGTPVVTAHAKVSRGPQVIEGAERALAAKYKLQWRVVLLIEKVVRRGKEKPRPVIGLSEAHQ